MELKDLIRIRRDKLGLSVSALARLINKDRSTVYRYQNGDIKEIPSGLIGTVARALQMPEELLRNLESLQEEDLDVLTGEKQSSQSSLQELPDFNYHTTKCKEEAAIIEGYRQMNGLAKKLLYQITLLLANLTEQGELEDCLRTGPTDEQKENLALLKESNFLKDPQDEQTGDNPKKTVDLQKESALPCELSAAEARQRKAAPGKSDRILSIGFEQEISDIPLKGTVRFAWEPQTRQEPAPKSFKISRDTLTYKGRTAAPAPERKRAFTYQPSRKISYDVDDICGNSH